MCECGNEAFDYFNEHPGGGDKSILKTVTLMYLDKIEYF